MFRRDGHPFSVEVISGLVVFVRGAIENPDAREAVGNLFRSAEADIRLAAARVLRDSMAFSDARDTMRRHLSEAEPGEEVRAEAAAALAHWSKSMSPDDDTERSEIISELLGSLSGSSEVVRFRLTSPLAQTSLTTEQATQLRRLASDGGDDVRRTAIEILGRRLSISPEEQAETVALFVEVTANDPSPQVRETGALALRGANTTPGAAVALVKAATSDVDPEVRAAAAASLASFGSNPAARETLVDVRDNDPNELVRASARRALGAR
jgi:HEAT repeat protein